MNRKQECPTCGGCGIYEEWFEAYDFDGNLIPEPTHSICPRCNGSGTVEKEEDKKLEEYLDRRLK